FQAEDGKRDWSVTGVQTCALPIYRDKKGRTGPRPNCRSTAALRRARPTDSAGDPTYDNAGRLLNRRIRSRSIAARVRRDQPADRSEERRVGKERGGVGGAIEEGKR